MAGAVGLRDVRYGYEGENHTKQAKDESNPYFTFDPSKCIVCSRCVRAARKCRAPSRSPSRAAASSPKCRPHGRAVHRFGMRVVRRLRAGLPDRDALEKSVIEIGVPSIRW